MCLLGRTRKKRRGIAWPGPREPGCHTATAPFRPRRIDSVTVIATTSAGHQPSDEVPMEGRPLRDAGAHRPSRRGGEPSTAKVERGYADGGAILTGWAA